MPYLYERFESQIARRMCEECEKHPDPSHDYLHVKRVVHWAKKIGLAENAKLDIVVPAAYLHDVVMIPKNDPRRSQASHLSAAEAGLFLKQISYESAYLPEIQHAIEAHSYSAKIVAQSREAQVVQDADRLDALGAIGAIRCFCLSGRLNRPIYQDEDPFAKLRSPDDQNYTLDHFFVKLYAIVETLHTSLAKKEGMRRVKFLKEFVEQLSTEI